ncbi:MAG TPA: class I SAM-dependent methyltransferase [Thermoplasmata archaeon]|nr:class I SAM-dependent methyltransferase [Thermoplasmata archaeon]
MKDGWRQAYAETPYRDLPWFSPSAYPWIQRAVEERWLRPGSRVLDLGCGAGTNALFLARSGYRAAGVDLAPGAIAAAKSRFHRAKLEGDLRVADALDLPFARGAFGGATDVGCFHTLPIRLRRAYAHELGRVVRPGGRYAVAWVGPEARNRFGPPHRPSVEEVASVFEEEFRCLRIEFLERTWRTFPSYGAVFERRHGRRPPRR